MQQINLFLEEFKRKKVPYSAQTLVVSVGMMLVVSVFISLAFWGLGLASKKQLEKQQQALILAEKTLEDAIAQYPAPKVDGRLEQTIESMEERKQRNQKLLKYLSRHSLSIHSQSFARMLTALSNVSEAGLWLTGIKIQDGGSAMTLTGLTQKAEALPSYLKKLGSQAAFQGMQFKVFDLNRHAENLAFKVSSERKEEPHDFLLEVLGEAN